MTEFTAMEDDPNLSFEGEENKDIASLLEDRFDKLADPFESLNCLLNATVNGDAVVVNDAFSFIPLAMNQAEELLEELEIACAGPQRGNAFLWSLVEKVEREVEAEEE